MEPDQQSKRVPVRDIARQIRDAADSELARTGDRIAEPADRDVAIVTERWIRIGQALERAHRKAFVPAIKPLRRLLRNQGAVNDSIIEALFHLADEIDEMADERRKLRQRLKALEEELRALVSHSPGRT